MTSLNKDQIKDLLPHREPMLLIDELHEIKKLESATGKLETLNKYFDEHAQVDTNKKLLKG